MPITLKERIEMLLSDLKNNAGRLQTPFFYNDMVLLRETLQVVHTASQQYGYVVHYAIKANADFRVLTEIKQAGLGADCVSGNEIRKALEVGFDPLDIVFAGVGKTDAEINYALDNDIFCFNCESLQELQVIDELAGEKQKIANVAIRINPDIDAKTHKHISTGLKENKFGIGLHEINVALQLIDKAENLKLIGLHFHIGSQITDVSAFRSLCDKINEIQWLLCQKGIDLKHINVGGGLGIDYSDPDSNPVADFETYFSLFNQHLQKNAEQKIHFELGRSITGQMGSLVSRVLFVKQGIERDIAILDAGMTELLRPALYQAVHKIQNISSVLPEKPYAVAGPICESADTFSHEAYLPQTKRGDIIVIRSAGAYGQIMSSDYNLRDRAQTYYSDDFEGVDQKKVLVA